MITSRVRPRIAAFAILLLAGGCVERTEWITVARDGSVNIRMRIEGTEQQLAEGDAMPSEQSGWTVERSFKKDRDEEKLVLECDRRFEPRENLPGTLAAASDPWADLYLKFPTTLRVTQRPDGLYYYFRRVYQPRRWAYIQYWQDLVFDNDLKKLSEKPTEELTFDERSKIVEAFAGFEAFKQVEFARVAMAEKFQELPVEFALTARRALLNYYDREFEVHEENGTRIGRLMDTIRKCELLDGKEKDACFDHEAKRLLDAGFDAFVQSLLSDAGLTDDQIRRFESAYQRVEKEYQVSEALGAHAFEVQVTMPGTIVAHNALDDDVKVTEDGSKVTFQFDGKAFRDRTQELIVVSKVGSGRNNVGGSRRHGNGR